MRFNRIPSSTSSSLRPAAAGLALCSLVAGWAGCQVCNDIGCGGGFEWDAQTADGGGLEPGAYAIEVTLEGTRFAIDCTIADAVRDSDCTDPTRVDGEGEFDVSFDLSHSGNDWNPDGPPDGFYLQAADRSGSEPDGSYSETRGPEQVSVVVQHDGQPLLEVDYDVMYVRDDDYRGSERCGFCDELEMREFEITS